MRLVTAAPLPYLLSLPSTSRRHAESRLPVLFFLHGFDEAAPTPIEEALTRHGPLRPRNPAIASSDFILIAPQLPLAGDIWHRYAEAVREILEQVLSMWRGDADRAYLGGFSFGGNAVFDLALQQPALWAALWSVDPTRVPAQDPGLPVWLSSGEVSRRRKGGFQARLGLASLDEEPASDRVYLDEGLDHVGTAASAYRDERVYRWLLAHRRDRPSIGRA